MEFKSEIDAFKFIMDMETYILESTPVPFTTKVMVDKDIMYDFLDRLRNKLPREMKECKRLIDARAKEHITEKVEPIENKQFPPVQVGERQVSSEPTNQTTLLEKDMYEACQNECDKMLAEAEEKAQQIVEAAYDYAEKVMAKLQIEIEQQIIAVKDGRAQIEEVTNKLDLVNKR